MNHAVNYKKQIIGVYNNAKDIWERTGKGELYMCQKAASLGMQLIIRQDKTQMLLNLLKEWKLVCSSRQEMQI